MRRFISGYLRAAVAAVLSILVFGCTGSVGGGGGGSGLGGGVGGGAGGSFGIDGGGSSVVVALDPLTASLSPGGMQQFTATVTGASDTAVVWSASGGTITPAGLFTAPQIGGGYIVRATSAADTRASGT